MARKELKKATPAEVEGNEIRAKTIRDLEWIPKTEIGRKVKNKEITDIDEILDNGIPILEKEIVDSLIQGLESELLMIGQSKGKFGGGARRVFKQTQKKTKEGNKPNFATIAVVGNKDGIIGTGYGKAKETVPAREKATRNAKLNIFKIRRGCGSWQCRCKTPHSIPFKVDGKQGSCMITLIPAPKGTGLKANGEVKKVLVLAGITDVWSRTLGNPETKINIIAATEKALKKLITTKTALVDKDKLGIADGRKTKTVVEE